MMTTLTFPVFRLWGSIAHFFNNFFLKPASCRPLAVLRIGLSLTLLWQAFLMRKSYLDFFAPTGFVQREVSNTLSAPMVPRLDWLVDLLARVGLGENAVLTGLGFIYVMSLLFLLVGSFTRSSAFLVWFLNWSFMNTGYSGSYGADMYAHIFLFYLMWIPCGAAYSLDYLFRRVSGQPTFQSRLGLRVLQLHMCISYLASGLEKASGEQWWNGEVLWIALNTPGYSVGDFHWLAEVPWLPTFCGWIVVVIELFYCVMVWHRKSRPIWVLSTIMLHLGIAIFLKLPIFGILMCVPTLALFAFSAEPSIGKDRVLA